MSFLNAAFAALPSAATSPAAFVAYIVTILAFVFLQARVGRNKQLLDRLQKFPPADRLKALELEMGSVRVPPDLTPEQWLRSRVQFYYLAAFGILCLTVSVVVVIAVMTVGAPGKAAVAVTAFNGPTPTGASLIASVIATPVTAAATPILHPTPTTLLANQQTPPVGSDDPVINDLDSSEFTVTYQYERQDDGIRVYPVLPYLTELQQGLRVSGIGNEWSPFRWEFPKLSIKVVNNSNRDLLLTEADIKVNASEINTDPVPIVRENFYAVGAVIFANQGWGEVRDPKLTLTIVNVEAYDANDPPPISPQFSESIPTFTDSAEVSIMDRVPLTLRLARLVAVFGEMSYTTDRGESRSLLFKSRVSLVMPGPGAPAPPSYQYNTYLEAGQASYVKSVPISQEIKPNAVDHFLLNIGTNKSARFDCEISFRTADKTELPGGKLVLDVFVPRSAARLVRPPG